MFSDRMMEVMGQPQSFQYVRPNIIAGRDRPEQRSDPPPTTDG
jgi:hypothetical protein